MSVSSKSVHSLWKVQALVVIMLIYEITTVATHQVIYSYTSNICCCYTIVNHLCFQIYTDEIVLDCHPIREAVILEFVSATGGFSRCKS